MKKFKYMIIIVSSNVAMGEEVAHGLQEGSKVVEGEQPTQRNKKVAV